MEFAAMPRIRKVATPAPAATPARPGDTFLDAFLADWQAHGPKTIESLRSEKPADYVRIAASLFAKQPDNEADPLRELTDAELVERIDEIVASLGLEIRPRAAARRADETGDGGR